MGTGSGGLRQQHSATTPPLPNHHHRYTGMIQCPPNCESSFRSPIPLSFTDCVSTTTWWVHARFTLGILNELSELGHFIATPTTRSAAAAAAADSTLPQSGAENLDAKSRKDTFSWFHKVLCVWICRNWVRPCVVLCTSSLPILLSWSGGRSVGLIN